VSDLSSWKQSFEIVNQELELAKRKKQALDELLARKRMSQPTYEHLEKGLTANILDLEANQRSLVDKMISRADELEEQGHVFEWVLANLEIRHVSNEMNEETYSRHKKAMTSGLDATKTELSQIRTSLTQLPT
jgi:hypothetical protein